MSTADADITLYGAPWCPDCRRSKKFLNEQRIPYRFVDIDADRDGLAFVETLQNGGRTIPTITFADGSHLLEPSNEELARKLGLTLEAKRKTYDLAIVGGGPAGLAAAIYAAREGIEAIVIERSGLGGQAGVTERIDNYPGFPEGIGGGELADRFVAQAKRYEVELLSAVSVESVARDEADGGVTVRLGNGQELCAAAVLLATGSAYRRLNVPGEDDLIGAGVHFCATCDGPFYRGSGELMVVGGGNSALEEGLFLTQFTEKVRVVQFLPQLTASKLLIDKVTSHPQFEIHLNSEVTAFEPRDNKLGGVSIRDRGTGEVTAVHPAAAFIFIGLDPNSGFVKDAVDLDDYGFITDRGFATSIPGVFVAGDVRHGSTKQLGAAVGDGIAALIAIRRYLESRHEMTDRGATA